MGKKVFIFVYVGLIAALAVSFVLPAHLKINPSSITLPADGHSRASMQIQVDMPFLRAQFFPHPKIETEFVQGSEFVQLFPEGEVRLNHGTAQFVVKSRAVEGQAIIRFRIHNSTPQELRVFTHTVSKDSDSTGIPDAVKLDSYSDREAFRRAFAAVAEAQASQISAQWTPEARTPSGLVCFAVREALRRHTSVWNASYRLPSPLASVEKYNFPTTPLGQILFRTRPGAFFVRDQGDGTFAENANAEELMSFNAVQIGRDLKNALQGDLLFYSSNDKGDTRIFPMIFLKVPFLQPDGNFDWVVYVNAAGQIIKTRAALKENRGAADLLPVASNRRFLGVYRLKIVR
ncbi:MAG: DUF1175 family protein [Acidobacteriia bacterium]|nr:DUF1175 family protein [Terriglobia bacterium]